MRILLSAANGNFNFTEIPFLNLPCQFLYFSDHIIGNFYVYIFDFQLIYGPTCLFPSTNSVL